MPTSKKTAEKLFKRKASPDTELSTKAFLKKKMPKTTKVVGEVKKFAKDYARNVKGGAKIVGKAVKNSVSKGFNAKKYESMRKKIFRLPDNY